MGLKWKKVKIKFKGRVVTAMMGATNQGAPRVSMCFALLYLLTGVFKSVDTRLPWTPVVKRGIVPTDVAVR